MTRTYKKKEPRRECIKAVKYTYNTSKGQNFKRIILGEIKEITPQNYDELIEDFKDLNKKVYVEC